MLSSFKIIVEACDNIRCQQSIL